MDTKHIHCMLEKMAEYGKCMIEEGAGSGSVNLEDAKKIVEMVGELAEAEYHALIAKEMRKSNEEYEAEEKYIRKMLKDEHKDEYKRYMYEYGEDGERRFYDNYRYKSSGRFAPRGKGSFMPRRGYDEPPYYHMNPEDYKAHDPEYWRDVDRHMGKMYYTEPITMGANRSTMSGMRDSREGRSGQSRRTYMETKEMHRSNTPEDKQQKMKELEKYMGELSGDITEMISDASNEEKTMLKSKLQTLAQKIQ